MSHTLILVSAIAIYFFGLQITLFFTMRDDVPSMGSWFLVGLCWPLLPLLALGAWLIKLKTAIVETLADKKLINEDETHPLD